MTYLDYAINASLVLSYMAMRKEDKAGIVTFSSRFEDFVPASRHTGHMQNILEILYRQQTRFAESDYSALVDGVNLHVSKRSLLVLYTSFCQSCQHGEAVALSSAQPPPPSSGGVLRG